MTFGTFSLSTIALVALYVWGVFQMVSGARKAGKGWTESLMWALVWPATGWKVLNDVWNAPPPAE